MAIDMVVPARVEEEEMRLFSRLLYSHFWEKFSDEGGDRLLHDGSASNGELEFERRMMRGVWEHNFLPQYHKACREHGIPEEYWLD